jgi:hypothetical protein
MPPISKFEFDEMQRRANAGMRKTLSEKVPIISDKKDPCAVDKEHVLHGQIVEEVKSRGWLCFYNYWGAKAPRPAGEPDMLVYAPKGRLILLEAKAKGKKLSPAQAGVVCHMAKMGFVVFTVRSIEHVRRIFDNPNAGIDGGELI